jgi:16S rRNA (cytosine967-C5)-methyltransferase
MCAGPGGKTALLAAESLDVGVSITANEVAPHRAQLVRSAVNGFKHVEVVEGDGRRFGAEEADSFDRILVDAPCSGLGALRRRPESRWRRSASDVATLTAIQSDLLMSALRAVKPGGLVAYVTCSPHLVETRLIVDRAITAIPGVHELDAKAVLASIVRQPMELSGGDLSAQLWPHRHNTDAMFISLLTK